MGTIAEKLNYLNTTKTNIRNAIVAKGVEVLESDTFRNYATKISEISGSAPQPTPSEWQPRSDWFDIKAIYDNDVQADYSKRYIYLLPDTQTTLALTGGNAYKTSDGTFYTADTTHTWDTTQDKTCVDGYKTRWVIVYNSTRDVAIDQMATDSLWLYLGDCNITSIMEGGSAPPQNKILQAVECSNLTTGSSACIGNDAFYACYALTSITIPSSSTFIGANAFCRCYALTSITIPSGVINIGDYAFRNCYALTSITIPSSSTFMGANAFYGCSALVSIILPVDFDLAFNAYISPLSISSMVAMLVALKDNTGLTAKTLTLGVTNLAKLTADEKLIATNKNWTLA